MDRIKIKQEAKMCVEGNRWTLWKPTLVVAFITIAISTLFALGLLFYFGSDTLTSMDYESMVEYIQNSSASSIANLLASVITTPLTYGLIMYYNEFEKYEQADVNIIFKPFQYVIKVFVINVFVQIIVTIGSILFVIPGMIMACAFSIIPYVYMKHPELGVMDMVSHAWRMMQGHKLEYFYMELSFLGWHLLGTVICGLAYIWIIPYYQMSMVKFFNAIDEEYSTYNIPHTTIYE